MKTTTRSKAVYTEIPPNPGRMIRALREMGYTAYDAILDLADNSLDANASRIDITIKGDKANTVIDILDNGTGMDRETLNQALRFGSESPHKSVDLGKYGMGLNMAGISLAREIYVLTRKPMAQAWEATFDLDAIERENRFVVILHEANGPKVFDTLGDQGTLVKLSRIDRPGDSNVARFADKLRTRIGEVYFHRIAKGVKFYVNGRAVTMIDPLMRNHPQTQLLWSGTYQLAANKDVHLDIVELPDLGAGNEAAGILPRNSGVYVYRNHRLIMGAQHFGIEGLVTHHHSYTGFRAELSFDGDLDADFHVDVKKGTIHPDHRMLEKLRDKLRPFVQKSGSGSRREAPALAKLSHKVAEERIASMIAPKSDNEKPAKPVEYAQESQANNKRFYSSTGGNGTTKIVYNTNHPFVRHAAKQPGSMPIVDIMTWALIRAEQGGPTSIVTGRLFDAVSAALAELYGG